MKIVLVRFTIEDQELEDAHRLYQAEHDGRRAPSDMAAFARDLQVAAYDDGGMHGCFEVLSVTDGGDGAAGGEDRGAPARDLIDLLAAALPYVEEAAQDPAHKPAPVNALAARIRAAIEERKHPK